MTERLIELDLKGEICPFVFVKTKLQLEEMASGDHLMVILDHAPAASSVPRSVKNEGHAVLGIESDEKNIWKVHIKKA